MSWDDLPRVLAEQFAKRGDETAVAEVVKDVRMYSTHPSLGDVEPCLVVLSDRAGAELYSLGSAFSWANTAHA